MKKLLPMEQTTPRRTPLDVKVEEAVSRMRHIIFVMSGKGGVGKSSVAVNLAAALAKAGNRVGILDVDLHGPSVPKLLGLDGQLEADASGRLLPAQALPNLLAMSTDFLLKDKKTAILWRGPKKNNAIKQFIGEVAWNDLDFMIIDSPPGTGDEHLAVMSLFPGALSLVVTTPQELALADVRKALDFLVKVDGRVLGVVENMSGFACPHCGHDVGLFPCGGGEKMAREEGVPFLGAIALDPAAVTAGDAGRPVVLMPEETRAKADFKNLAERVLKAVQET